MTRSPPLHRAQPKPRSPPPRTPEATPTQIPHLPAHMPPAPPPTPPPPEPYRAAQLGPALPAPCGPATPPVPSPHTEPPRARPAIRTAPALVAPGSVRPRPGPHGTPDRAPCAASHSLRTRPAAPDRSGPATTPACPPLCQRRSRPATPVDNYLWKTPPPGTNNPNNRSHRILRPPLQPIGRPNTARESIPRTHESVQRIRPVPPSESNSPDQPPIPTRPRTKAATPTRASPRQKRPPPTARSRHLTPDRPAPSRPRPPSATAPRRAAVRSRPPSRPPAASRRPRTRRSPSHP